MGTFNMKAGEGEGGREEGRKGRKGRNGWEKVKGEGLHFLFWPHMRVYDTKIITSYM